MNHFLEMLDTNYTQNIILIVTVVTTVVIYYCQKWSTRRDAARSIIIQIDIMDGRVDTLAKYINYDASTYDAVKFWQSEDIAEENEWNKYRHMFVKKLNYNEIVALNQYFDNLSLIGKQQKVIKEIVGVRLKENIDEAQNQRIDQNLNVPTVFFQTILLQRDKVVSGRSTLPYEKLRKIAKM